MKRISKLFLNTDEHVCVGVGGWGKSYDDKVVAIEGRILKEGAVSFWGTGNLYAVALSSGRELVFRADAVIGYELEEVPDDRAATQDAG